MIFLTYVVGWEKHGIHDRRTVWKTWEYVGTTEDHIRGTPRIPLSGDVRIGDTLHIDPLLSMVQLLLTRGAADRGSITAPYALASMLGVRDITPCIDRRSPDIGCECDKTLYRPWFVTKCRIIRTRTTSGVTAICVVYPRQGSAYMWSPRKA